jgi:hypothetical protein
MFNDFNYNFDGTMDLPERLKQPVADTCRAVGDQRANSSAPCSQRTYPHRHTCVAVWGGETPRQAAVARVVRDAHESAMAGEGAGHD